MAEQPQANSEQLSDHKRLVTEIELYEKEASAWEGKGKKILRRYKDQRPPAEENLARYNILWSNTQTLLPALFAKNPKPNIERRFKDNDPLGRVTSDVLERATDYFINSDKFSQSMRQTVLDLLLPGRGTAWARYIPHFKDVEIEGTEEEKDEGVELTDAADEDQITETLEYEEVAADYVHWENFGHNVGARTWDEVYIVWREVFYTQRESEERFGEEKAKLIPLDYTPKGLNDEKISTELKKSVLYELWDKHAKKVYWLHKDMDDVLDETDDPLRLPDFFPCPRPLLATTANDSLLPVPDYQEYQDQARELDELTGRIAAIKKALKVSGVYDSSAQGLERILAEGVENQLVPVDQFAMLAEKGGLAGVISFMPMKDIVTTLLSLYEAREQTKQDLYELTGMSDLMRGATDANETATAQNLKGQYGNMRLRARQDEVQRFARDLVRIFAQIIAEHFSLDTIKEISGVKLLSNMEKQQLQTQIKMAQQPQPMQPGQATAPPPPIPEEIQEMLEKPTWEEVYALLRNDSLRCFRIDIETDSTIRADEDAEKDDRVQFLQSAGAFLESMVKLGQEEPELTPLCCEMLRFGVTAFRVSKPLEGAFNVAITAMEKKAQASEGQPKPNPQQQKVQSDIAIQQARAQADQQTQQSKMEMDKQKMEMDYQLDIQRMEQAERLEERKMQMEFAFRMRELGVKSGISIAPDMMAAPGPSHQMTDNIGKLAETVAAHTKSAQDNHAALAAHIGTLMQAVTAPKKIIRDSNGRAIGAQTELH